MSGSDGRLCSSETDFLCLNYITGLNLMLERTYFPNGDPNLTSICPFRQQYVWQRKWDTHTPPPTSDSPHRDTAFLDPAFWEVRLRSGPRWWCVRLFHVGSVSDVLKTTLGRGCSTVVASLTGSYRMILQMTKSSLWVRESLRNVSWSLLSDILEAFHGSEGCF